MGQILYTQIASGGKVSGDVDLRQGRLVAVYVPAVLSGDMYVQGGFDATSGNFGRLHKESGLVTLATGPGSVMVLWPDNYPTPSYVRFEAAVAQTSTTSLTVLRR